MTEVKFALYVILGISILGMLANMLLSRKLADSRGHLTPECFYFLCVSDAVNGGISAIAALGLLAASGWSPTLGAFIVTAFVALMVVVVSDIAKRID